MLLRPRWCRTPRRSFGAHGDLLILGPVAAGLHARGRARSRRRLRRRLAVDLLVTTPFGLTALAYSIVGYGVGAFQSGVLRPRGGCRRSPRCLAGAAFGTVPGRWRPPSSARRGCSPPTCPHGPRPSPSSPSSWCCPPCGRPVGRGATGAGRCWMCADAPTPAAPARDPRHRRGVAVRRPLRPASGTCRCWRARVPARRPRPTSGRGGRAGAPGPHPRSQRRGARRQPAVVRRQPRPPVPRELDDDDRADVLDRLHGARRSRAQRSPSRSSSTPPPSGTAPTRPVPVLDDIPEELAVYLTSTGPTSSAPSRRGPRAIRTYPFGAWPPTSSATWGRSTTRSTSRRSDDPLEYQLTDEIGKSGVELTYEEVLRAARPPHPRGRRRGQHHPASSTTSRRWPARPLPVDRRHRAGRRRGRLREELGPRPPRMRDGTDQAAPAGSVVVLDANDGSVLAMASYPTYNPGASPTASTRPSGRPQRPRGEPLSPSSTGRSRATTPPVPPSSSSPPTPGSVRAPSRRRPPSTTPASTGCRTAAAAAAPSTTRAAIATGGSTSSGPSPCRATSSSTASAPGSGSSRRPSATRSRRPPASSASVADSGIVPLGERAGWIPTPENTAQRHEDNPTAFPYGEWYTGNNVNVAVGQGDVLSRRSSWPTPTPRSPTAAALLQPNVAREVRDRGRRRSCSSRSTPELRTIDPAPGWREAIMAGFTGVTQDSGGTADGTFAGFPNWVVAGKTGTAEVAGRAYTSLFVGDGAGRDAALRRRGGSSRSRASAGRRPPRWSGGSSSRWPTPPHAHRPARPVDPVGSGYSLSIRCRRGRPAHPAATTD